MFESLTDLVKHEVHNASTHEVITVADRDEGIDVLRANLTNGESSRLVSYRGYYVKQAWAMSATGEWLYSYRLVWREW